jgi:hypothetical protein
MVALTVRLRSELVPPGFCPGTEESWEDLRSHDAVFGMPPFEDWQVEREKEQFREGAAAIAEVADKLGAGSITAYGVGCGYVEGWLASHFRVTLCDVTASTIEALQRYVPKAESVVHDIRDGPLQADLHLMFRLDTEFDDNAWRTVLGGFRGEPVLFVPGALVSTREAILMRLRPGRTAGWARTRDSLIRLWTPTHSHEEVAHGFLLAPLID